MPTGRSSPGFASSGRRLVVAFLLLFALQRLEAAGGGAAPTSPFPSLNNFVRDGSGAAALFCSSLLPPGRHGGGGRWKKGGSGSGRGGKQDLEPLHAGSSVAAGFAWFCVCRGSWWAICCSGATQMRWNPDAAVNPLYPIGLASFNFVLASHGGEETAIGDVAIWMDGGGSDQKEHQHGNIYMAASLGCCDLRSAGASSSCMLSCCLSGCNALYLVYTTEHEDCAFLLFGTCRRRASLLRFLRFNGKEPPDLSSVWDISDQQLNSQPHKHRSTRLLVEPLALRLTRWREAQKSATAGCLRLTSHRTP